MSRIITISREFGSGGRELGKRLADALGFAYYDREIITFISEKSGLAESYVESVSERGIIASIPLTYGRTFAYDIAPMHPQITVFIEQEKLLHELAEKGDCVIVGRCADVVLADLKPLNLFVYADMDSRVERCMKREPEEHGMDARTMRSNIRRVDRRRASLRGLYTHVKWGDKSAYHLCINTSGRSIKSLIPAIVEYQRAFFNERS